MRHRMKRIDKLRFESVNQLKIMHPQKPQATTVSEHHHRGVSNVKIVVADIKVITHHHLHSIKVNYVYDSKRTETRLYAVIEGSGVKGPGDNGRLLLYKEKENSTDGCESIEGKSGDRETDEGGGDSGDEEGKARSDDREIDVGGDDSNDEESTQACWQ